MNINFSIRQELENTDATTIKKLNDDGRALQLQTIPNSSFSLELETSLNSHNKSFDDTIHSVRKTLEDIKELGNRRNETLRTIEELLNFVERLNIGMEEESKTQIKQPSQLSQKTFKLMRLKEAIESKTAKYSTVILNKDPSLNIKIAELSQRWSSVCEPLIKEYLTMKTASTEYGQFKTLAAQESDWLERLEKKLTKAANQAAADAEEISEELDDLENCLNNHSDERSAKIQLLAKSISEKGILIDNTSFVVGGSGGGSFSNSEQNRANVNEDASKLKSKWASLEKQARERISILERSIAEAQEWEYKLIAVQDWLQGKYIKRLESKSHSF